MTQITLVAHGQPGNPEPQERALHALAAQVALLLPGHQIRAATLAMPGALAASCDNDSVIYPMFMAEGWFTRDMLPRKLAEAGAPHAHILRPFGANPTLPGLILAKTHEAAAAQGWQMRDTTLLLAAHGSARSQASFTITNQIARQISPHLGRTITGFVEQSPYIADAAQNLTRAICLPLFATEADHVTHDLPEALDKAGFDGLRLPPIGCAPEVPQMIAASIAQYEKGPA